METSFVKTKDGKMTFTVLSNKGDEKHIWDFEDPQEVEAALKKFGEYVDKKYTAVILGENGQSDGVIKKDEWDKLSAEERRMFFDEPKEVVFIPLQFGG